MRRLPSLVLALALLAGTGACGGDAGPGPGAGAKESGSTRSGKPDQDLEKQASKAEREAAKERRKKDKRQDRAIPAFRNPVLGADVSWPQCPQGMGIPERQGEGQPMPLPGARYVVIGLTNGPGFTPNPCLADQLAWAKSHKVLVSAYSVVSLPAEDRPGGARHDGPFDDSTPKGRLANAGHAQALFNIATMKRVRFETPFVWVDVEPYPVFPWSEDVTANAEVVRGAVRGYQEAGYRVGFYSTPNLWQTVVGDLAFGLPEWRAAGNTGRAEAERRCAADWSIQGGPAVMGQWTDGRRDFNITCFNEHRTMDRWFARP